MAEASSAANLTGLPLAASNCRATCGRAADFFAQDRQRCLWRRPSVPQTVSLLCTRRSINWLSWPFPASIPSMAFNIDGSRSAIVDESPSIRRSLQISGGILRCCRESASTGRPPQRCYRRSPSVHSQSRQMRGPSRQAAQLSSPAFMPIRMISTMVSARSVMADRNFRQRLFNNQQCVFDRLPGALTRFYQC